MEIDWRSKAAEAERRDFERHFGPDDPYDFPVPPMSPVAVEAFKIAAAPALAFCEMIKLQRAKDPRTDAERLADARRERGVT